MAETITAQRAKARERTRQYRERLKGKGVPEARVVDQALLHALVHLQAKGRLGLTKEAWLSVIKAASLVLRQKHNRNSSEAMIAERVEFHAKGEWIRAAEDVEANPPDAAALKWLKERGII